MSFVAPVFRTYDVENNVPLKFYQTTGKDGKPTFMANHKGLAIFSHYDFTAKIIERGLMGKTMRVNIIIRERNANGGWGIATPVYSKVADCLLNPDVEIFDQAPIIMIDGQNFLRTLRDINPQASAYFAVEKLIKKFRYFPKFIRVYICPQTVKDIKFQWENLKTNLVRQNLNVQIIELQAQQINVGNNSYIQKSDIDPLLLKDLGRILERYRDPRETLVLFTGDSDYLTVCQEWLGNSTDPFSQADRGRLLMLVSSSKGKGPAPMSPKMKEVCNDPNAGVIEIADLI